MSVAEEVQLLLGLALREALAAVARRMAAEQDASYVSWEEGNGVD